MAKKLTEEEKAARKLAADLKKAEVANAQAQPKSAPKPAAAEEAPRPNQTVTLKGKGMCSGWVNGKPFAFARGVEIVIPDSFYNVLLDADEIE